MPAIGTPAFTCSNTRVELPDPEATGCSVYPRAGYARELIDVAGAGHTAVLSSEQRHQLREQWTKEGSIGTPAPD
jgi:hypothetical protein